MTALPTDRPDATDTETGRAETPDVTSVAGRTVTGDGAETGDRATTASTSADELRFALQPLLARVGGSIVAAGQPVAPGDVEVPWRGDVAFRVRLDPVADPPPEQTQTPGDLTDALANLIAEVERELGSALAALPRAGKQRAVRLLEERGAFELRRSAETVAEALGVTRFTVYNYLNRSRADG